MLSLLFNCFYIMSMIDGKGLLDNLCTVCLFLFDKFSMVMATNSRQECLTLIYLRFLVCQELFPLLPFLGSIQDWHACLATDSLFCILHLSSQSPQRASMSCHVLVCRHRGICEGNCSPTPERETKEGVIRMSMIQLNLHLLSFRSTVLQVLKHL